LIVPVCFKYICRLACAFAILIASMPADVRCDIYKYVDRNGVMHFTNVPTSSSSRHRVYLRESSSALPHSEVTGSYADIIYKAAKKNGVAAPLLKAIIKAESNFNPRAVSRKGALGLMQIMPGNLKSLNIRDPFDPKQNIMGGARYFKRMMNRFGGKLPLAIAAYNAGPEKVARYQRIPPIKETENYVRRVLKYYNKYRNS
jgi:soluble lytic murein transglycosylase-like protein